jgi:hypothetical protein
VPALTDLKRGSAHSSIFLRDLLAVILGAWADVLTAWQKAAFAVVYDVCLIATMIAIEALGHAPAPVAARARAARLDPETEPANIAAPPQPRLVVNGRARPAGSIPKILSGVLEPGKGRVEMEEIYAAYAGECGRHSMPAVLPEEFVDPLERFCKTCRIKMKVVDGKVYLLNVRLVPQMATLEG